MTMRKTAHNLKHNKMNNRINLKGMSLLLLLVVSAMAKAQKTTSMFKNNSEWNILWESTSSPTITKITESLKLDEDTLIGNVTYKKLLRKLSSQTEYWQGCLEYCPCGLIREESSGKVFFKPDNQNEEYLLYDFSMNINDTAVMYWCQNPNSEIHIRIDSIATKYFAGFERRVFYVSSKDMYGDDWRWLNTWVEGIGAMEGLLYSCHIVNAGGITLHRLLCYHEDDDLLYINEDYNSCMIDTTPTSTTERLESAVYYDPCSQQLLLFTIPTAMSITIFDIYGRVVFDQKTYNDHAINLSFLPKGTYIVVNQQENSTPFTIKFVK